MDQAALQRVALVRTSGSLCWTVWSAREQQSLRTWIVSFYFESAVFQLAHSSGEWSLFWISGWPSFFAMLQCTAGTLLGRRHSGSTWTVLQIFLSLAPSKQCIFWWCVYYAASMLISTTARCWLCLIVSGRVLFLTRHGSLIHPEMNEFVVAGYGWSLTQPCVTAQSLPLGRSPQWGGAQDTWSTMSNSSCSCLRPLVLALSLNLDTWTSTREWTLRGWVSQQCIVNATLLSSWQHYSSLVSRFWVTTNSFVACFWVYCDTVDFLHCVSANLVVFLVGLLPRSLFVLLSSGWWDANLAGGSASSCLVFLVCVLVVVICQVACDHQRPCNSFLTYSFFSCKDRASERDRPYQRKKKGNGTCAKTKLWQSWTKCNKAKRLSSRKTGGRNAYCHSAR